MKKYLSKICRQVSAVSIFLVMLFSAPGFLSASARLPKDISMVSDTAPEFQLLSLSGKNVALSDFKGKPVILFIWSTWCPYCVRELAYLEKVYADIKKNGVELLAIDSGEPKERVARYLSGRNINFPVLLDIDSRVSYAYNVIGIPTLILVDAEGKIKFQGHGLPEDYLKILSQK